MTFAQLMTKLNNWILTTWNPANSDCKVAIKARNEAQSEYDLTPASNPHFLLMSFKKIDKTPPYQLSIMLDNCKLFFKGIVRTQEFYEAVHSVLNSPSPYCFFSSSLKMKKLEEDFLIENRHQSPELQEAYDRRFGLTLK